MKNRNKRFNKHDMGITNVWSNRILSMFQQIDLGQRQFYKVGSLF